MSQVRLKYVYLLVVLILAPHILMASSKTDTVYLKNGDRISGEVKRMEFGILFLKTDGLGTIKIEFDRISTFYAKERFTVRLSNGLRFFGSIDTAGMEGHVILRVNEFRIPEPLQEIVELYPVKNAFWQRLDGAIDIGYSYTKASSISQINLDGNLDYRMEKSFTSFRAGFIITDQEDMPRIRKQDYTFSYRRIIKRKWFAAGAIGAQQNTELGVNYRYWGGPAVGNNLVNNNLHVLNGLIGLLVMTEGSAADSVINSIEGLIQVDYRIFRFSNPEIDVKSHINMYPSLTTVGRYRMEYDLNARIEIFDDFYFGVRVYDTYDSKPVDNTAANNDWGITTSVGYSW
ncbi:MAG: DUF481 domain-containing protein [Bacteroidota bacterium]